MENKITRATVKSFIKKNFDGLYINVKSDFDGMTDGLETRHGGFKKAESDDGEHCLGVKDAYFVGGKGEYFYEYEDDTMKGIRVSNCCGRFILAIKK